MKIHYAIILLSTSLPAGLSQAQDDADTVRSLMKSVVIPQSDIVFAVGKKAPANENEWSQIVQSAAQLTEAAKSLSTRIPAASTESWRNASQAMANAAIRVGAAAKSKNADAVLDAGDLLYESCEACHRQHLRK